MSRRLLIPALLVLLLAGFVALYASATKKVPPPVVAPALEQKLPAAQEDRAEAAKQKAEADTDISNEDFNEKPKEYTVRGQLKKSQLVDKEQHPDMSITLKREKKVREVLPGITIVDNELVLPGVTLTDKEVTIPLEKANESLHIRREANDQTQLLYKQKF